MTREEEAVREQYAALTERFPGKEAISLDECLSILPVRGRYTLINDTTFPVKKICGRYVIPLMALARWMC